MLIQLSNYTLDGQNIVIQVPEQWATIGAIIAAAIIGATLSFLVAWQILHKERELRLLEKKYEMYDRLIEWGRNTLWKFEKIQHLLNKFVTGEKTENGKFNAQIVKETEQNISDTIKELDSFFDIREPEKRDNVDPQKILNRLMPSSKELLEVYLTFAFIAQNLKEDLHEFNKKIRVDTEEQIIIDKLSELKKYNKILRENIETITYFAQKELRIQIKIKL